MYFFLNNLQKKLFTVTQKNIYKKKLEFYRSKLTGDIEYKPPSRNLDEFLGFLKMKNDFKIEKLNIHNFIPRYSMLKCTEWFFINVNRF